MRLRQWSVLLLGIVLLSAAALASAQDGERDGRGDDEDRDGDDADEVERKVEVESDDEGVSFEFKRESGDSEDKMEAEFSVDDARFEVKYESENVTAETEMSLSTTFESLLEYRDTDDDGRYSDGDEIVSAWAIGDPEDLDVSGSVQWGAPILDDVTVEGQEGKRVRVPAVLGDEGLFELRFYVFGDYVDLGGVDLKPTSVKIDILITNYPYIANDTALALLLETETKHEAEREDRDDEEDGFETSRMVNGTETSLVFTWLDHAEVDGSTEDVQTTVLSTKEESERDSDEFESKVEHRLAFSYPRGNEIVHDPQTELRTQSVAVEDSPGPGFVIGVVVLLGAAFYSRRS